MDCVRVGFELASSKSACHTPAVLMHAYRMMYMLDNPGFFLLCSFLDFFVYLYVGM